MNSDLISRQEVIEELKRISFSHWFECGEYLSEDTREIKIISSSKALEAIEELPSAQEWIPITTRPMTEDERKEWSEKLDFNISDDEEAIIYGNLPDDGQRVLVYNKYSGGIGMDTFFDDDEGCYFEDNGDMDGITHWMPLPELPKTETGSEVCRTRI